MLELCGRLEYSGGAIVAGCGGMAVVVCGCIGGVDDIVNVGCIGCYVSVNCGLAGTVPPAVGGVGCGGILVVVGGC